MRKILFISLSVVGLAIVASGCYNINIPQARPYVVAPLSVQARSIALLDNIPQNCTYLGIVEGIEQPYGHVLRDEMLMRESAINKAKNQAALIGGFNRYITILPVKEDCRTLTERPCQPLNLNTRGPDWLPPFRYKITADPEWLPPLRYKITAQVYDCGAR